MQRHPQHRDDPAGAATPRGTARPPPMPRVTHVTKTMKPEQPGCRRWRERYGERLVCVRYREDAAATRRYITVELLVEDSRIRPQRAIGPASPGTKTRANPIVQVRIEPHEVRLRERAYAAGATCHPTRPIWHMPLTTARALRVLRRIVEASS